jgi:hypothetical protein
VLPFFADNPLHILPSFARPVKVTCMLYDPDARRCKHARLLTPKQHPMTSYVAYIPILADDARISPSC